MKLMLSKTNLIMRMKWLWSIRKLRKKPTNNPMKMTLLSLLLRLISTPKLKKIKLQLLLMQRIAKLNQERIRILLMKNVLVHQISSPRKTRVRSRPSKLRKPLMPRLQSSPLIKQRKLPKKQSLLQILPREPPPRTFLSLQRKLRLLLLMPPLLSTRRSSSNLRPSKRFLSIRVRDTILELNLLSRTGKRPLLTSMNSGKLIRALRKTTELLLLMLSS